MTRESLNRDYFANVYAQSSDPWNFTTSPYEHEKYQATIAALGPARYAAGFEIGCSVGVLTSLLATHCDSLYSIDINERALRAARERNADLPNVRFACATFPKETPSEPFDLIVMSEVAYYWSDADLAAAIDYAAGAGTGCTLVLVHFLPPVPDYVRGGDAVHAAFLADSRLESVYAARAEMYRIDVLRVR